MVEGDRTIRVLWRKAWRKLNSALYQFLFHNLDPQKNMLKRPKIQSGRQMVVEEAYLGEGYAVYTPTEAGKSAFVARQQHYKKLYDEGAFDLEGVSKPCVVSKHQSMFPRASSDLLRFIKNDLGTLRFAKLQPIIAALLKALHNIHDHHMAHGDLKAENILCYQLSDKSYAIEITDFEGATFAAAQDVGEAKYVCSVNSPHYSAPEIIDSPSKAFTLEALQAADVWSLGYVLFALVLAKFPQTALYPILRLSDNTARSQTERYQERIKLDLQDPQSFQTKIDNMLDEVFQTVSSHRQVCKPILKKMLRVNPHERPRVRELLDEFRRIYTGPIPSLSEETRLAQGWVVSDTDWLKSANVSAGFFAQPIYGSMMKARESLLKLRDTTSMTAEHVDLQDFVGGMQHLSETDFSQLHGRFKREGLLNALTQYLESMAERQRPTSPCASVEDEGSDAGFSSLPSI